MATTPEVALNQLRRDARSGALAWLCRETGIELLVAFGSATDPHWPAPPGDLDLAVILADGCDLLQAVNALTAHLGSEQVDVMDLGRASDVARAQAFSSGELLYERDAGTFAEQQILAIVQQADTEWLRTLQLDALAR